MEHAGSYGQFQLLRYLARGQVTEVFLARDPQMAGPEGLLVVERLLPEVAQNPGFVETFLDEAGVAGTLKHPNIIQIYDLGELDGQFFIAMEYVRGGSLHDLLDRRQENRISLADALFIASEVCTGLQFAHSLAGPDGELRNLVHRELNPRHVLVSVDGVVKIADFGMATALEVIGVPPPGDPKEHRAYLAPEQLEGKPIDRRADIYACGALLYRLATGQRPGSVVDNSLIPPQQVNPELPQTVVNAIIRAMSAAPKARHPTCGALRRDIIQAAKALPERGDRTTLSVLVQAEFPEVCGWGLTESQQPPPPTSSQPPQGPARKGAPPPGAEVKDPDTDRRAPKQTLIGMSQPAPPPPPHRSRPAPPPPPPRENRDDTQRGLPRPGAPPTISHAQVSPDDRDDTQRGLPPLPPTQSQSQPAPPQRAQHWNQGTPSGPYSAPAPPPPPGTGRPPAPTVAQQQGQWAEGSRPGGGAPPAPTVAQQQGQWAEGSRPGGGAPPAPTVAQQQGQWAEAGSYEPYPSQPPVAATPSRPEVSQPPPKPSRSGLWIGLIVGGITALLLTGLAVGFLLSPWSPLRTEGPGQDEWASLDGLEDSTDPAAPADVTDTTGTGDEANPASGAGDGGPPPPDGTDPASPEVEDQAPMVETVGGGTTVAETEEPGDTGTASGDEPGGSSDESPRRRDEGTGRDRDDRRPRDGEPEDRNPGSSSEPESGTPSSQADTPRRSTGRTGRLYVLTAPYARVYLDSRLLGTTPIINREVPAGRHTLYLVNPSFPSERMQITVRPGEVVRVRHIFNQ